MSRKTILNFVLDEKFTDLITSNHDKTSHLLPDGDYQQKYIFVGNNYSHKFKYIKNSSRIEVCRYKDLPGLLKQQDIVAVFLHSLYSLPVKIIPDIPPAIKVYWFSWGYDIYERPLTQPLLDKPLYHELTKIELNRPKYFIGNIMSNIRRFVKSILYNGIFEKKTYLKALSRINYYSGVLPFEYDLIKDKTVFDAKPIDYRYVRLSSEGLDSPSKIGKNIMVGNSANPSNNHLDVFSYLRDLDLTDRKIIVPISYGGKRKYATSIERIGRMLFGDRIKYLTSFMEYNHYKNIINDCGIGVFLLERQQGMGNINMLLRDGCKVFLSETSELYKYYKSKGIKVFSCQSELTQSEIDTPLSEKEKLNNRNVLMSDRTAEAGERRMYELYQTLK